MNYKEKIRKLLQDAKAITELAISENRNLTEEEKVRLNNMLEDVKTLKQDAAVAEQLAVLDQEAEEGERQKQKRVFSGMISDRLIGDERFKGWLKSIAPDGRIPDSTKGLHSPVVAIGKSGLFKKDLITGTDPTSAGAFVVPEQTGIYEPLGRYPTVLRDLIAVRTTTSDTVEYVRQTTQVAQAAPTAEANVTTVTGYTGEVSGEKPEGSMAFERVQEPVKTIAVWIPATKRAVSDAAQLRGLIDQELREDLADELENQMFTGNGVGENFTGLANTAGILVQEYDTDIIRTTRQAITTLLVTGRQRPTAWVFNPLDWETIELLQDGDDRYYYGGPQNRGQKILWGLPAVESFHAPQGTGWLGNWKKAVLWDREDTSISVSDSHADFFIRNMLAILGELRAAFGVIRPSGFVQVELS